ncbi:sensor histidine kinase KdpD [Dyadobacter sp. CY347]|uniref:sensor histidine kinase n=1 Tax=Dyadobacter sp. CY347 TaxID=2909336 RepID=UPI001F2E6860|nr:HAMP domain-containing sensor histidine kinase [Dyadobacter sp. CY347]MCF2488586.1 HAMP domain-containing histidine kinase [Dyadobacter sp. CY347]
MSILSTSWFKLQWERLPGHADDFPLQSRIYHFVCLATIAAMLYVLFYSISVQMVAYALVTAILIPLQIFLFYMSLFRNRTALSMKIYILIIHGFFFVGYRLGAGIAGSTLLSFCIVYFLSMSILPRKEYALLTIVNLGTVAALLVAEFNDPGFVLARFTDRSEHFIDIASTYAVNIILMLVGLGFILRNYTQERDKAEERAMLLDDLHEEKARLISVISHDYHTPLTALKNYLNVLEKYELSGDELRTLTTEMRHSIVNTQSLLKNLLDMTKEATEPADTANRTTFPVLHTVDQTLKVYADIARSTGQALNVTIPEKLVINSNPHLFAIVIRNLINNAVKFSGPDAIICFSYEDQNPDHLFCIADSGPGIPDLKQKEITESWEHTHRNVSRSGAMGLVLARKYAAALGGQLSFETEVGKGTTFTLKIPRN